MADTNRIAIALLAAGGSRRFGKEDKLAADFRGQMLGLHAARTISALDAQLRLVIASRAEHPCSDCWRELGFDVAVNSRAAEGMGSSVALAARRAGEASADILLLALADMPLVPRSHFATLISKARTIGSDAIIASFDGRSSMPPACFGKAHFASLEALSGDRGARELIQQGLAVTCPPEWLIDVDDPETLARHS